MAVYLTQSNRDLTIDEKLVKFVSLPTAKTSVDEVTVILYPDSLVSKYSIESRVAKSESPSFYQADNGNVLTKRVMSDLKRNRTAKNLLGCTMEHMAAVNIFKVFVQAKNLRNINVLLTKLTSFINGFDEHSHYFTFPFILLTNLQGSPVRSSCELISSRTVISSSRRLSKLEILSINKIYHKIPTLDPENSEPMKVVKRRGRSILIPQHESDDITQVDISSDHQNANVSSIESDASVQSAYLEVTSDLEALPCILKSANIVEKCWLQDFMLYEEIGQGNFATVKRCSRKSHTDESIAVKLIEEEVYKSRYEYIKREIDIIASLRFFEDSATTKDDFLAKSHPNIIVCYCIYYKPSDGLAIFTEYANNGDLFSHISEILANRGSDSSVHCMDEKASAVIVYQILSALDYLQNYDIVHRDIKPENILLHKTETSSMNVKLCDFGLAVQIDQAGFSNKGKSLTGICGTPYYIAPEMLLQEGYGMMVDVWAVGIVLFVMLSGYPPFYSEDEEQNEVFDKILECDLDLGADDFSYLSQEVCVLLYSLLCFEPDFRILPSQAMEQPWFKKMMS